MNGKKQKAKSEKGEEEIMRRKPLMFTPEELRELHGSEKPIRLFGKRRYRVGKMSYGDYFFEPIIKGKKYGEKYAFKQGTIWAERKVMNKKVMFMI